MEVHEPLHPPALAEFVASLPLRHESELHELPPEMLDDFLRALPKAELHLHIEGTLEPELAFEMAARNGVTLPYATVDDLRAAYSFTDLQSFLDIYYATAAVLQREDDFHDLAWAYLQRAHADTVVRAEVFFDPQTHTSRGVDFATVIAGLTRAAARAREELGMGVDLIMCFLRHLSEADAFETLEAARPHIASGAIFAVGLDSGEAGHPPEKFQGVFERCRELGLRIVAHAGEEGPAEYVAQAMSVLGAQRVDHGIRSVEDPAVVAALARSGTPLTVCPLSNLKLRVVPCVSKLPLRELLEAGVVVTLNSDDPAYFGGYVHDNWAEVARTHPALKAPHFALLAEFSIAASFAPEEEKAAMRRRLHRAVRTQLDKLAAKAATAALDE